MGCKYVWHEKTNYYLYKVIFKMIIQLKCYDYPIACNHINLNRIVSII